MSVAPPRRIAYTGEASRNGYRMSKFFVGLTEEANRAAFKSDPEAAMQRAGLSEFEKDLIRKRDFLGMLDHGVAIYALGKAGGSMGLSLLEIGARMRGETVEQFLATRPLNRQQR